MEASLGSSSWKSDGHNKDKHQRSRRCEKEKGAE